MLPVCMWLPTACFLFVCGFLQQAEAGPTNTPTTPPGHWGEVMHHPLQHIPLSVQTIIMKKFLTHQKRQMHSKSPVLCSLGVQLTSYLNANSQVDYIKTNTIVSPKHSNTLSSRSSLTCRPLASVCASWL